jgi:hypothetical protein
MPDFLVISPGRTGTTWLAEQLRYQPDVFVPPEKEIHYFSCWWHRYDINWYLEKFLGAAASLKGDISPSYICLPEAIIQLIQRLNPNVKLVFLARRLPEHTWSHTRHCFFHRESIFRHCRPSCTAPPRRLTVKYFLSDHALSASDYTAALRRWMRYFPQEQFHVRYFEDATASPEAYLLDLYRFLGICRPIAPSDTDLTAGKNSGRSLDIPDWADAFLADIHADRQHGTEEFLASRFGLRSPWKPLARRDCGPLRLNSWYDGWRVYFYKGLFCALPEPDVDPDSESVVNLLEGSHGVIRRKFLGDLNYTIRRGLAQSSCKFELGDDPESQRLIAVLSLLQRDLASPVTA